VNDVTNKPTATCHFMATALAIYDRDGANKQRHVNVLIETANPNLTKADLGQITSAVLARVKAENDVLPKDIKDVVILNIVLLGVMPADVFHGAPESQRAN
jgi:hypothetical protein